VKRPRALHRELRAHTHDPGEVGSVRRFSLALRTAPQHVIEAYVCAPLFLRTERGRPRRIRGPALDSSSGNRAGSFLWRPTRHAAVRGAAGDGRQHRGEPVTHRATRHRQLDQAKSVKYTADARARCASHPREQVGLELVGAGRSGRSREPRAPITSVRDLGPRPRSGPGPTRVADADHGIARSVRARAATKAPAGGVDDDEERHRLWPCP